MGNAFEYSTGNASRAILFAQCVGCERRAQRSIRNSRPPQRRTNLLASKHFRAAEEDSILSVAPPAVAIGSKASGPQSNLYSLWRDGTVTRTVAKSTRLIDTGAFHRYESAGVTHFWAAKKRTAAAAGERNRDEREEDSGATAADEEDSGAAAADANGHQCQRSIMAC